MIERIRVVTCPRGSWRWQHAHRVVAYRPWLTRDGRWVWRSHHQVIGRSSMPQLRRAGYGCHDCGSLHNRPLTREEVAQHLCELQISAV